MRDKRVKLPRYSLLAGIWYSVDHVAISCRNRSNPVPLSHIGDGSNPLNDFRSSERGFCSQTIAQFLGKGFTKKQVNLAGNLLRVGVKANLLADKLGVPETALDRKIRRLQRKSSSAVWNRILRKTYGLRIEDHSKIDEN